MLRHSLRACSFFIFPSFVVASVAAVVAVQLIVVLFAVIDFFALPFWRGQFTMGYENIYVYV